MCVTETQSGRELAHIFLLWRGPLFLSSATAGQHTRGTDRYAWVTSRSLPSLEKPADLSSSLERPLDLCLQFKITDFIFSLKSQAEIWTSLCFTYFLFMAGYRNLLTSGFFFRLFVDLICERKYLSLYKLYSSPSSSPVTNFVDVSCDRIEHAKLIHGTLSLAKLVYYNTNTLLSFLLGCGKKWGIYWDSNTLMCSWHLTWTH